MQYYTQQPMAGIPTVTLQPPISRPRSRSLSSERSLSPSPTATLKYPPSIRSRSVSPGRQQRLSIDTSVARGYDTAQQQQQQTVTIPAMLTVQLPQQVQSPTLQYVSSPVSVSPSSAKPGGYTYTMSTPSIQIQQPSLQFTGAAPGADGYMMNQRRGSTASSTGIRINTDYNILNPSDIASLNRSRRASLAGSVVSPSQVSAPPHLHPNQSRRASLAGSMMGASPTAMDLQTQSRRGSLASPGFVIQQPTDTMSMIPYDNSQSQPIDNSELLGEEVLNTTEIADDVKQIHEVLKSHHSIDTKTLIHILTTHTPTQTTQLSHAYKATYGKNLADDMKSLHGDFGRLCRGIILGGPKFDAIVLKGGMSGMGTDEDVLIETLVGRTNAELVAIKDAYFDLCTRKLDDDIGKEVGGGLKKLLVAILQAQRPESPTPEEFTPLLESDVETLFQESRKPKFTLSSSKHHDPSVFISLLCGRNDAHLGVVFDTFQKRHGETIEGVVRRCVSEKGLERGLIALVHSITSPAYHISTLFESALHTTMLSGPSHSTLIRLCVRYRDPRVMKLVREAYWEVFGRSLYRRVEEVTKGEFGRMVLGCVGLDVEEGE